MIHDTRIASCGLLESVQEWWSIDKDFSRFTQLRGRNLLI
jgi:hypothetical protein